MGRILFLDFQKILLLQNPLNLTASEVIQTYVYKVGLQSGIPQYSYSSAIGLFASLTSFILLIITNRIARRISETSLW
jgi:ABC-type polysaccharide transport system permease subunit